MALRCQFVVTDARGLTLDDLAPVLHTLGADLQFRKLKGGEQDLGPHRAIIKGGVGIASLSVVGGRAPAYKRIVEDFAGRLTKSDLQERDALAARVRAAVCILTVDYLDGLAEYGSPKDELAPMWRWLLEFRDGVLDVGGRGFARGLARDVK